MADGEEVGTEAGVNKFDDDLDHAAGHDGVDYAPDAVVDVPEGPDAELHCENKDYGDAHGNDGIGDDWDMLRHLWITKARLVDLAVLSSGGVATTCGRTDSHSKEFTSWNGRPEKKTQREHSLQKESYRLLGTPLVL